MLSKVGLHSDTPLIWSYEIIHGFLKLCYMTNKQSMVSLRCSYCEKLVTAEICNILSSEVILRGDTPYIKYDTRNQ